MQTLKYAPGHVHVSSSCLFTVFLRRWNIFWGRTSGFFCRCECWTFVPKVVHGDGRRLLIGRSMFDPSGFIRSISIASLITE